MAAQITQTNKVNPSEKTARVYHLGPWVITPWPSRRPGGASLYVGSSWRSVRQRGQKPAERVSGSGADCICSALSLRAVRPPAALVSYYCGWGIGSVPRRSNENQTRSSHQTAGCGRWSGVKQKQMGYTLKKSFGVLCPSAPGWEKQKSGLVYAL